VALTFPLFGYIISWSTWENVFHFCGISGTIWFIAWQFLVFDTPAQHPRISDEERRYIEKSLGVTEHPQKRRARPGVKFSSRSPCG
jgi:MFS transporter, ACS family, solute carrier family 17 (sodium-dependent inorganic phosphate cotransporter), member 5